MNREQRRRAARLAARATTLTPEQQRVAMRPETPIKLHYGYNDQKVVVQLEPATDHVSFTLEQAEAFHAFFGKTIEAFREHIRGRAN